MDVKLEEQKIKKLFIARICLWIVAASANIYWIYWNFKLYSLEIFDVHAFAKIFRPKFYTALAIAFIAICVSFYLRSISDRIKRKIKYTVIEEPVDEDRRKVSSKIK